MYRLLRETSNPNCFGQLFVDIVSAILDGNRAATPAAGYHRDGLAAVAAKGKQKGIQLFVIGVDAADDIFLSFLNLC